MVKQQDQDTETPEHEKSDRVSGHGEFKCESCGMTFNSEAELHQHEENDHLDEKRQQ